MRSIRERPEEALDREVPGHWEGDFIKEAFNGSAILLQYRQGDR